MPTPIHSHPVDIETLYVLMRQSLRMAEASAKGDFPLTAHMLRIAAAALEDEMRDTLKAAAEIEARYL